MRGVRRSQVTALGVTLMVPPRLVLLRGRGCIRTPGTMMGTVPTRPVR